MNSFVVTVINEETFAKTLYMNSFVVTVINEETFAKTWYVETCCAD